MGDDLQAKEDAIWRLHLKTWQSLIQVTNNISFSSSKAKTRLAKHALLGNSFKKIKHQSYISVTSSGNQARQRCAIEALAAPFLLKMSSF